MTGRTHGSCQCGAVAFGVEVDIAWGRLPDGTPMVAINVNCFDGVDPRALPARHFDGRAS